MLKWRDQPVSFCSVLFKNTFQFWLQILLVLGPKYSRRKFWSDWIVFMRWKASQNPQKPAQNRPVWLNWWAHICFILFSWFLVAVWFSSLLRVCLTRVNSDEFCNRSNLANIHCESDSHSRLVFDIFRWLTSHYRLRRNYFYIFIPTWIQFDVGRETETLQFSRLMSRQISMNAFVMNESSTESAEAQLLYHCED